MARTFWWVPLVLIPALQGNRDNMRPRLTQIARDIRGAHLTSLRASIMFTRIWLLWPLLGIPHPDRAHGVVYALVAYTVGYTMARLVLLVLRRTHLHEHA